MTVLFRGLGWAYPAAYRALVAVEAWLTQRSRA